jgi:uracil-DNA glycosylase family 4
MTELEKLALEICVCTLCPLARTRTRAVPGEGHDHPELMFIGEGPGFNEDQQGRPFVGQAGRVLEGLLGLIGLERNQVYITNVVKCRPPSNRDPLPTEVSSCHGYLKHQIELLAPKLIITLGRFSMDWFFPQETISRAHGKLRTWNGYSVLPVYHPAAALRNSHLYSILERDFLRIPEVLTEITARDKPSHPPEPRQLSFI